MNHDSAKPLGSPHRRRAIAGAVAFATLAAVFAGCGVSAAAGASVPPPTSWAALEARPLHLPSVATSGSCPVTPATSDTVDLGMGNQVYMVTGQGPVYVAGGANVVIGRGANPGYSKEGQPTTPNTAQETWLIAPGYTGLALVRGRNLSGSQPLTFSGGLGGQAWARELRLQGGAATAPVWTRWKTGIAIPGPGCYGVQIDTSAASYIIVFRAVLAV